MDGEAQQSTLSSEGGVVHPQSRDGGPAKVAQRQESQVVGAPGEVLAPSIAPWVEETDFAAGERVTPGGEVCLEPITVRAGGRQILGSIEFFIGRAWEVTTARRPGQDVVDLQLPAD